MRLHWDDGPDLPEAFRRAAADVTARGDLARCVGRCRRPRCLVALAWWWDPALTPDDAQNEHLTLLVLDRAERRQWFFDPGNLEQYDLPVTDWMDGTALVPGFRPHVVRFGDGAWSLQGYLSPLDGDDNAVGGACTTACLLVAAALWRFGLPEPHLLLAALSQWLEDLVEDPLRHRAVRRRLFRWQHAVAWAGDRRRLFALLGLSDAVGDVAARPCAVFRGSGICTARTASVHSGGGGGGGGGAPDADGAVRLTLCRAHAGELLDADALPAGTPDARPSAGPGVAGAVDPTRARVGRRRA